MPKIDTIRLRCRDPGAQKQFYCDVLGMRAREDGTIGYEDEEAGLLFEAAEGPYRPSPNDLYWKIAIGVPNIELAQKQLTERGVPVGTPRQVQEIAYLAHFKDPEGFTVELLDHWFEGDRPSEDFDGQRLGGGPHLNLLTLRSADIERVEQTYADLGLTRLSVVPAPDLGFTLYFYAFTNELPPNSDLCAVENRLWVYRRPYTVLEIQLLQGAEQIVRPHTEEGGYGGVSITGCERSFQDEHLWIASTLPALDQAVAAIEGLKTDEM